MDTDFKVGDVVILRSGGPNMTVTYIERGGKVTCHWYHDGKYAWEAFPPAAIEKR